MLPSSRLPANGEFDMPHHQTKRHGQIRDISLLLVELVLTMRKGIDFQL
jgi:hypothetical protein